MTQTVVLPQIELQTPNVLVIGPPGVGKTYSIVTLLKAGIETFCLLTEPNAIETLLDAVIKTGADMNLLHWCYTPPASAGWSGITGMAKAINTYSFEDLAKQKSGVEKSQSNQIMKLLNACANFPCERTGQSYGDITSWGPNRALVLDSLTGLNILAMDNTVGQKPTPAPGEWGTAMNLEEKLILKLTSDLKCFFVLLAHIDRVTDEVMMTTRIVPAALGNKLGPKIGRFFSEIVLARKVNNTYVWATSDAMADLKNRALPLGDALAPSYQPIIDAYRKRVAAITPKAVA
jgi:hypothetical protein